MGEWDVFCAFCGAEVRRPYWDEEEAPAAQAKLDAAGGDVPEDEDEDEYEYSGNYDPRLVRRSDAEWMCDTRIISENPESTNIDKYAWESPQPIAFPFHYNCYDSVLRHEIKHRSGTSKIDNELLYETMKSFCPVEFPLSKLDHLDYGEISECQGQFFSTLRGTEHYVVDPAPSSAVTDMYNSLPRSSNEAPERLTQQVSGVMNDFGRLPPEIILQIMRHLPLKALLNFSGSTKKAYEVSSVDTFWKQRLKLDMPWIYDMPDDMWQRDLDWAASYKKLYKGMQTRKEKVFLSLANRRRIWTICEPLVNNYLERVSERSKSTNGLSSQLLDEATCPAMPRLILPQPNDCTTSMLPLIRNIVQGGQQHVAISVYWNDKGHLVGFGADHFDDATQPHPAGTVSVGDDTTFAHKDSIRVDNDSWLIGIQTTVQEHQSTKRRQIVSEWSCVGVKLLFRDESRNVQYGQATGAQRLFMISPDHLLVGLRLQWSKSHGIARIGLLEVPLIPGTWNHRDFYSYHERMADSGNQAMQCLWSDRLPPAGIDISEPKFGYWAYDFQLDIEPMEALVFGTSEDELSKIVSFAADIRFSAFEVGYADGTTRKIGRGCRAMKTMKIDGVNGERFVGMTVETSCVVTGFRLQTNWARQFVMGTFVQGVQDRVVPSGRFMAGIYCNWTDRLSAGDLLEVCGLMTMPDLLCELQDPLPDIRRDERGLPWDPSPPPTNWTPSGPLVGQYERIPRIGQRDLEMPSEHTIVNHLDCSKPVDRVLVVIQHPKTSPKLRLASLAFVYVDGTTSVVGPDPVRLKQAKERGGEDWSPDCHWDPCGEKEDNDVDFTREHYDYAEWSVGGSLMAQLKVWTDKWPIGLQFVADNGSVGPQWGACEGDPSSTIRFVGDEENDIDRNADSASDAAKKAVGLKLFTNGDGASVTYPDINILGFQALVLED